MIERVRPIISLPVSNGESMWLLRDGSRYAETIVAVKFEADRKN